MKKFREYLVNDSGIDIQRLVADGEKIVDSRIQKLQAARRFLDKISQHVTRTNRIQKLKKPFIEEFPQRYFLTEDYAGSLSDCPKIDERYSRLFSQCKKLKIMDNFNQGLLLLPGSRTCGKKVFVEIPLIRENLQNLYIVPAGKYRCTTIPPEELAGLPAENSFRIVKELFDLRTTLQNRLFEVQQLL